MTTPKASNPTNMKPKTKGILIDAKNNKLSYVEINHADDINKHGCFKYFEVVHPLKKDDIFVDDEGLINNTQYGFEIKTPHFYKVAVYFGNGIVLGHDGEGNTIDCTTTIEELAKQVRCFQTAGHDAVWYPKLPTIA